MANHKSAIKEHRQSLLSRDRNRRVELEEAVGNRQPIGGIGLLDLTVVEGEVIISMKNLIVEA